MTYNEVLVALNEMIASGNFTYLKYLELISQNWFSFAQWCFSYAVIWSGIIFGSFGLVAYIKYVVKSIRQEIEE